MLTAGPARPPLSRRGAVAMRVAGAAFVVFLANAIVGKASLLIGGSALVYLGNVAEFLLLGVAVGCFVVGILAQERAQSGTSGEQTK